jgi:hypothetical protein
MSITNYPRTPRLINHFTLGTDPEFTFLDANGLYVHAENLELDTMSAFGCDMAGRQAELRAHPSRFTLEVVASMVDALRWMSVAYGRFVIPLKWEAKAWNGKDGCGGHLHFGRKKSWRKDSFVLDENTKFLHDLNVLNQKDFGQRVRNTHYGRYGDVRLQKHGFEYRTLPTTLESPWLCYFVMVINKLAVHENKPLQALTASHGQEAIALLKKYQYLDDDAAIALQAVKLMGFPEMKGVDMKPNWGLPFYNHLLPALKMSRTFFPSVMKAEQRTCEELFLYLTQGVPLPNRRPTPTWELFDIPEGFHKVDVQRHTLGHLPDTGMNLISRGVTVSIQITGGYGIHIQSSLPLPALKIKHALKDVSQNVLCQPSNGKDRILISVSNEINKDLAACKTINRILSDTELFPICKAKNLATTDWTYWDNLKPESKPAKKLGKVVGNVMATTEVKVKLKPAVEAVPPGQYQVIFDEVGQINQIGAQAVVAPAPRRRPAVRRVRDIEPIQD